MNILFVVPYPFGVAGSQRFRFEQYLPILQQQGHRSTVKSFIDKRTWKILYKPGHFFGKVAGLISGYIRRWTLILQLGKYDVVFIHREASPFGLPLLAWFAKKVFRKHLIFDFDDAIWLPNASESNRLTRLLKRYRNVQDMCRWASVVSAGNDFLADHAKEFNPRVVVNPTTIDTDDHHNQLAVHDTDKFVIGWTGSHSTVQYLDLLLPVFKKLENKFDFELRVICDEKPKFELKSLKFLPWNKSTEISDLLSFNVGIMPLPDNVWTKGKCGFKALQYMSLGIPAVVSDVGVNNKIVDHQLNGIVCKTTDDWYNALSLLMTDHELVKKLSAHTREKVIASYSVRSNTENFLSLFSLKSKK